MLSVILKSKLIWSALGGAVLVLLIGLWYKDKLSEAEQTGYDKRSIEQWVEVAKAAKAMREENDRLRQRDSELVAQLADAQARTPEVITRIVEVTNEIDDTTCTELPVDFVRIFNAAADPNCTGGGNRADCPVPEVAVEWTPEHVAPASNDDAPAN